MTYLQSFWSKPLLSDQYTDNRLFRFNGGFPDHFFFLCAWTYSCLTIRKYYPNLHLVTDSHGIRIFKDILELPYASYSNALDDLDDYHEGFWAVGKLRTYQLQKAPFCHIDGDIFLFGTVLDRLLDKQLFCQSYDYNSIQYSEIHPYVHNNFREVDEAFAADLNKKIKFLNVGILGGTDIGLFQDYTRAAMKLIDANQDGLENINVSLLNLYYEQFLLSNIAAHRNIQFDSLYMEADDEVNNNFVDFTGIPQRSQYIHLISAFKRSSQFMEQVVVRLLLEYPVYYQRIVNYKESIANEN